MTANVIKILLIEDNPADAHLIRMLLTDNKARSVDSTPVFELLRVERLAAALEYLEQMQFDVVLLDLSLPDSHGLDTFETIKQLVPQTAVVVLSGLDDETIAHKSMQQGAQDYLVKGSIDSNLLNRALLYAIERQNLLTELQEKTRALEQNEAYRLSIIENNADGIVIVGEGGIIRFVNPAAEEILDRSQAELIDRPFNLPATADDPTRFDVFRRDGTTAVIETRFVAVEWQGEPARQVSLRDITDHVQAKAQLKQQTLELQHRNAELDDFAHTVAHQVQGLLGQIIGYSSFIDMNWGSEMHDQARLALKRVLHSSHKMNNVLSEILLLASVNRDDVQTAPLDMGRIVSEACKRLSIDIEEYEAKIHQMEQWPQALGYPSWIEEVWVNYISNGLKYGGDPPILHLGAELCPNGMVRFWVHDNGQGITPSDQEKLFKAHTRLQQTRARGEGLGLSIVRRIVEKCGGKVGVDSQVGQGSTFWFCLPQIDGK